MIIEEDDYLAHYGILRRSGRYPWGSGGGDQATQNKAFLDYVEDLRRQGLSEVDIARGLGTSTTQLRAAKAIAKNEQKQAQIAMAKRLKDKGLSNVAIGERMNLPESTVRTLLKEDAKYKADVLQKTAEMLKEQVAEKKYVDVGAGTENYVGVTENKLKTAIAMLREDGYNLYYVNVPQIGTGKNTTIKVLASPDTTYSEVYANRDSIRNLTGYSEDGGKTFVSVKPKPLSVNPNRVGVTYKEDGGDKADGVIYVRRGVEDISLGNSNYAQVRIAVGDGHYLKGMAMYKDDLPPGIDLMFNTNKSDTGNKLDAMKPIKDDPDNPFGATVRQIIKRDANGNEYVSSAMNIVNEEGNWSDWSRNISSQVLSKQSPKLAKSQLDMTYESRKSEYDDIMALTNPTVKRKLLETFADETDSASVHLKAAALPRQASHVILPINSMKETEVYAPNYRDGEKVVLIRHPHGGTFEIPELTVNNRQAEAKRLLGNARDAVGINYKVAERLSGADFDGDTVLVIPNNRGKVTTSNPLDGLKNFDPKASYPAYEGMKPMSARTKQLEMGDVSNLITDMTTKGASTSEIARAVRHSMVVIDAEKHNLNWKQSALDNGIPQLKEKYQGNSRAGASTLISRATSQIRVPDRKPRSAAKGGPVDKETGRKVFEPTGETYINKKGERVLKTIKSEKLAETDDANTLSSGTPIERIYADHSNKLKALANQARLSAVNTPNAVYSPSAKRVYEKEVASLNSKLTLALRNAPLERQAQLIANATFRAKKAAKPDMDEETIKKEKARSLNEARIKTGAKKHQIVFTDREWEAIQAGAVSDSKLRQMLLNSDLDRVKQLATPRENLMMTSAKTERALSMLADGYTRAEVADALGVSISTLDLATSQSDEG